MTNHLLCVTAATLLFQKGVHEQLIMAGTGSEDRIRIYKKGCLLINRKLCQIFWTTEQMKAPEDSNYHYSFQESMAYDKGKMPPGTYCNSS